MRLHKVVPKFAVPLLILLCAARSLLALDVSGTVVDENGKPLAGVRVAAGEARSVPELTKPVEGVTDADGRFVIKDVPDPVDSPYLGVEAYAPGRVPASDMVKVGTAEKVKLALKPARNVAIQLLEMSGAPASKVKITGAEFTFPSLWGLITETGADGKIVPYAPETGSMTLSVADSRYVHADIQLRIPEDDGAKFRVIPGGVIEGTLLDAAGKPISGAGVSARANTLGFWGGLWERGHRRLRQVSDIQARLRGLRPVCVAEGRICRRTDQVQSHAGQGDEAARHQGADSGPSRGSGPGR